LSDFRYRDDVGFERRCPMCADWWPVTLEFWDRKWQSRCRACVLSWRRDYQNRKYRDDPDYRQMRIDSSATVAWKVRQWRPEAEKERKQRYAEANADRRRELQRIKYWQRRDEILARRRALRAEKAA
jgi:hypothetical protein